jgi:hypothetical protein
VIVVEEYNRLIIFSRVKTKQGMKQLEDHKVMDPQLLYLLVSGVAILVRLKGGHNAGLKLTMILGGRAPKFVHIISNRSSFDISSLLIHKIVANP